MIRRPCPCAPYGPECGPPWCEHGSGIPSKRAIEERRAEPAVSFVATGIAVTFFLPDALPLEEALRHAATDRAVAAGGDGT